MRSHPGVSAKFFSALADVGVNIEMISTSEIRISVIVDQDDVDRAVVAAHTGLGLDTAEEPLCTPVLAAEASLSPIVDATLTGRSQLQP